MQELQRLLQADGSVRRECIAAVHQSLHSSARGAGTGRSLYSDRIHPVRHHSADEHRGHLRHHSAEHVRRAEGNRPDASDWHQHAQNRTAIPDSEWHYRIGFYHIGIDSVATIGNILDVGNQTIIPCRIKRSQTKV